jgi:UDP-glucose 4-epimerase
VVTVRVSSCYGPNTRFNPFRKLVGNTLIAALCRAAAYHEEVVLDGGGDYPRDWTYAADTAAGVALAYLAKAPRHDVYNIACGQSYVLTEVVDALRRVAPDTRVTVGAGQWDSDPFQALNLRGPLDITRARTDLGFEPRYTIEDGLRAYIAWWEAIRAADGAATDARFDRSGRSQSKESAA